MLPEIVWIHKKEELSFSTLKSLWRQEISTQSNFNIEIDSHNAKIKQIFSQTPKVSKKFLAIQKSPSPEMRLFQSR